MNSAWFFLRCKYPKVLLVHRLYFSTIFSDSVAYIDGIDMTEFMGNEAKLGLLTSMGYSGQKASHVKPYCKAILMRKATLLHT